MPNYRVDYAPKNKAAWDRGCVDVSYTIRNEKNPTAARRLADESLGQEFNAADYKRGKVFEVAPEPIIEEETPTAAVEPGDHNADGSQAAVDTADTDSVAQAAGDSWGQLYGTPTEKAPAPAEDVGNAADNPAAHAGADLTVADVEALHAGMLLGLNAAIDALPVGGRLRREGIPAEIYHRSIGWGSTRVKDFIKSPALARAGIDGHMEKKPTKSQRVGTAYHAACLEPELFTREYTQADKMPINDAEYDDVIRMRDATMNNLGYLLQGGAAEVSYWYRVSENLVIKCRIDYELPRLALDLKSAVDVSDEGIVSAVDRFGYALQQEHYILASGCGQFAFLFQQNAAPWLTSLPVELDDDLVEYAQLKLDKTYREIEQSEANDYWPVNRSADDGGVQTLVVGLKGWKRKELEELRIGA